MTPFRMKARDAAAYCGMSLSAFARAVSAGDMPHGKRAAGGIYWLRSELEAAMLGRQVSRDFKNKRVRGLF